jgi:hypothetical protein
VELVSKSRNLVRILIVSASNTRICKVKLFAIRDNLHDNAEGRECRREKWEEKSREEKKDLCKRV